jgi:hypothetical protein
MPDTPRTKIASAAIDNGNVTISYYSDPANGPQTIAGTVTIDIRDFSTPTIYDLAATGFAATASTYYQRGKAHPDVPAIATRLHEQLKTGKWHPGKAALVSEPTDLMRALAEATGTPVATVEAAFKDRMVTLPDGSLYRDARGHTRRYFDRAMQMQIAQDPKVAPILSRLIRERLARQPKPARDAPSMIDGLFHEPSAHEPANPSEAA